MAEIWANLLDGFKAIFSAPLKDLSVLWLLAPIILFWLILEIYFGRYKREKVGWNTALGYGLTMFWVVVISFRTMFENDFELFSIDKLIFLIFIAAYSLFIIFVSFTHRLREKVFFLVASPSFVYYLFLIAILLVHDVLDLNLWVVIDLIIIYIIILILETILKKLMPGSLEGSSGDAGSGGMSDTGLGSGNEGFGNMGKGFSKL